jgi:hypothetical protein
MVFHVIPDISREQASSAGLAKISLPVRQSFLLHAHARRAIPRAESLLLHLRSAERRTPLLRQTCTTPPDLLCGEIPLENQMDIEMKGINVFDYEPMVAVGRLEKLWTLTKGSSPATDLPGDIPVLTCPIAATDAPGLESNCRQSCFGFGRIQLDESVLMAIRLQRGDIQVYWVAEMTDPETWAAIDMWKRVRRVPIAFKVEAGDQWRVKFCTPEISSGKLSNEQFRTPDREPTARTWHGLASLVGSGLLQRGATSDIPGLVLRRVFVNALLTERLEPFTKERPVMETRVIVRPAQL